MNVINNHVAQKELLEEVLVIIDVREPIEFNEYHIQGAINIPSSNYKKESFETFQQLKIALVCQSGQRARKVKDKLYNDGFENVFILENQMQNIEKPLKVSGWSIDRQFRMTLGILLAVFLVMHFLNITSGIVIPIILSTGLIVTAMIDRCYLRMGIGMLPWNKDKKIPN